MSVLTWSQAFPAFEQPVEVGNIIKTASVAYLANGLGRIHHHTRSVSDTNIVEEVDERLTRSVFDESGEGHGRESYALSHVLYLDFLGVVSLHVVVCYLYAFVGEASSVLYLERDVGQLALVGGYGHGMEESHQFYERLEALFTSQVGNDRQYLLYGLATESYTLGRAVEHIQYGVEDLFFKEGLAENIAIELYGYLSAKLGVVVSARQPSVVEIRAYDAKLHIGNLLDTVAHHALNARTIQYTVDFILWVEV